MHSGSHKCACRRTSLSGSGIDYFWDVRYLFILIGMASLSPSFGQESLRTHISFDFGGHFPSGDLADRFGFGQGLGGQFEAMLTESLWHAGVKGTFIFGNQVKEDVVSNLRTDQGDIIGNDRTLADLSLRMRAFFLGGYIGKTISIGEKNPQSGIKFSIGGGFLQHKIRLQDNSRNVNQITEEYESGYDRKSNGPALYGFIGYQNVDLKKRFNFHIGLDYMLGFTQNRRAYNFNEMQQDNRSRLDGLFGVTVGWIIPITRGESPDSIFY